MSATDTTISARILHKKNGTANTLPTSSDLEYGELAINYADGTETLAIKNSADEIVTFSSDEIIINKVKSEVGGGGGDTTYDEATTTVVFTCPDNLIVKQSSSAQTITAYCYLTEGDADVAVSSYSLSVSIPSSMSGISLQTNSSGDGFRILAFRVTSSATPSGYIAVTCTYGDLTILRYIYVTTIEEESDITITGDDKDYITASGHTIDVTDLISTLGKVASKYDAGYYYSSSASNGVPVDPQYWGTTSEGFELDDTTYCYLWYTNDGVTWKLVMYYTIDSDDTTEYYYVCTTIRGIYVLSSGTNKYFPAGFCTFMRYASTVSTAIVQYSPIGAAYYMSYESAQYEANGVTATDINERITLLDTLLFSSPSPVVNTLPTNYSEYHYVWRITVDDFDNYGGCDYTKWTLCATMEGAGDEDLVTQVNSDIGNFAGFPGVKWVTYDGSSGTLLYPSDTTVTNAYPYLVGSPDNWVDESWVKYFLMAIVYDFCKTNKVFYGERLGFNFNSYQTSVYINGYGGWANGRLGTFVAPSDDVEIATPYFLWLNGSLYGYLGYRVDFFFQQVCIGKVTDIYMINQSITTASSIASLISSGSCQGPFYDITSWHQSSYAIITNLSTGDRTLCKYTNGVWGATEL